MIKKIKKIKKKIFNKNFLNFIIKIGKQFLFLKKKYLINNCIIKTWLKIIIKKKIFIFSYSKSLIISGILKLLIKIINKNYKTNIYILFKFNILKILKISNFISFTKKNSIKIILLNIFNFIKYN
ncbi:SufE family protein [Candidatus Carsonella ruddii]|uniref:SufE protein probably involved in Fe-S center assembly n=1 Tax=Candidatus Carsonella ruddii CE isolate Thao2000 TaxID=1202536 RepID=J7GSV5_CARRU|nr:SufE family protein [Candidatus Carsonella ruddii]AFP83569.1 SufE protein probably involved in Fe-S center assembly [Candidatus Carsonella ruddii CE isolate Thao2000]